jgi:hypothetical protein
MNEAVKVDRAGEIAKQYAGQSEEVRDYLLDHLRESDPDLGAAVAALLGEQIEYTPKGDVAPTPIPQALSRDGEGVGCAPSPSRVYWRERARRVTAPVAEEVAVSPPAPPPAEAEVGRKKPPSLSPKLRRRSRPSLPSS